MINSATADVPTIITAITVVRRQSYVYRLWVKKVYIKSPIIGFDRNPLVTHADFDHISPICGEYHDQYHHATHLTHHI